LHMWQLTYLCVWHHPMLLRLVNGVHEISLVWVESM
jgi:hypothetical protein